MVPSEKPLISKVFCWNSDCAIFWSFFFFFTFFIISFFSSVWGGQSVCWAVVQRKAGVWSILCSNQSRHEYYLHTSVQCHLSTRRCWAAGGDSIQQWDCGNNCQGRTGWHLPLAEGIILYLVLRCSVYNLISYICLKKKKKKIALFEKLKLKLTQTLFKDVNWQINKYM